MNRSAINNLMVINLILIPDENARHTAIIAEVSEVINKINYLYPR
jgi:hypothetical protein